MSILFEKPVLMIHEVQDWMLELPLEKYVLTFDDGLYSQYKYIDQINQFDTEKIFFISSNIVCNGTQKTETISCEVAHQHFFEDGDNSSYMTIEQIKHLLTIKNVQIGAHSHGHGDYTNMSLVERTKLLIQDTETMMEWFDNKLNYKPTSFCFPYNKDYGGIYAAVLKRYGFKNFYGQERIPIETLSLVD